MGPRFLVAVTLPGVVIMLTTLAAVEHVLSRLGRRSLLSSRRRHRLSSVSVDVFSAAVSPGKATELEQHRVEQQLRDDAESAAPPGSRIDLAAGVAYLRLPPTRH